MHTLFLAPTGFGGGLNSISLGLIRTLEGAGLKVGFFKPIAQPFPVDQGRERSCILVEKTLNLPSPEPLALEQVERQLADGELDLMLEEVVSRFQQAAAGKDVVIVEGMVPTTSSDYTSRISAWFCAIRAATWASCAELSPLDKLDVWLDCTDGLTGGCARAWTSVAARLALD